MINSIQIIIYLQDSFLETKYSKEIGTFKYSFQIFRNAVVRHMVQNLILADKAAIFAERFL